MISRNYVAIAGFALVAVGVAELARAQATKSIPKSAPTKSQLDAEAQNLSHQLWDRLLTKCGDSYYLYMAVLRPTGARTFVLHQYRDATFAVRPRTLTITDGMNGIQWDGLAVMASQFYRSQEAQHSPIPPTGDLEKIEAAWKTFEHEPWAAWDEWSGGTAAGQEPLGNRFKTELGNDPNRVWITKQAGRWSFYVHFGAEKDDLSDINDIAQRKLSCAEIPDAGQRDR